MVYVTAVLLSLLFGCVPALGFPASPEIDVNTVITPSGKIMGIKVPNTPFNSHTYQYRRIPYAEAPVGDLRFANPKPKAPWQDTLNATEFGPSCMQVLFNADDPLLPNTKLSEDCLFLNIYVPPNTTDTSKKPVMVFIHGGSYVVGQGMFYDGSFLAIHGDLIVVTINYRLGIWGFLTTADANCRGNFGLWDQRLSLQWVKNNIKAFGGDPDMVTIFGESAGGFSVSIHSLIPSNKGLFLRSMAHSGTANSIFAVAKPVVAKVAGTGLGVLVGCYDIVNSAKFVKCMRSKSAEQLLDASIKAEHQAFEGKVHFALPLAPVVDDVLIQNEPVKVLSDPSSPGMQFFKSLDFVNGDVNSEGSLMFQEPLNSSQARLHFNFSEGIPYSVLCDDVIGSIVDDYFNRNSTLKAAACSKYKSPSGDGTDQSQLAVKMYSDLFFFAPGVVTLNSHIGGTGKTYQFLLPRESKYGFGWPYPKWFTGAGHAGELAFLFGIQRYPTTSPEDLQLANQMLSYWSNFARTGNPNTGSSVKIQWPEFSIQDRTYIDLNATISTEKGMYRDRVDFWIPVLPKS